MYPFHTDYFLRKGIFLCKCGLHWIILDVSKDRYLCVPTSAFDLLAPWIQGWTASDRSRISNENSISIDGAALGAKLIDEGILTEDPDQAKAADISEIQDAKHAVDARPPRRRRLSLAVHLPTFLFAATWAGYLLKNQSFQQVVRHVKNRERRWPTGATEFSMHRAAGLVFVFNALRPLYPRNYLCLFDSLALVKFLALYRIFPQWVFGVSADPFCAHCWVQHENWVLNDRLERVLKYKPIMSI